MAEVCSIGGEKTWQHVVEVKRTGEEEISRLGERALSCILDPYVIVGQFQQQKKAQISEGNELRRHVCVRDIHLRAQSTVRANIAL